MSRNTTNALKALVGFIGAVSVIGGAFAYTADRFVSVRDAVATAPVTAQKVAGIEAWIDDQDARWEYMQWWMEKIGKKSGIPTPPLALRRRLQARTSAPRPD